MEHLAILDGAVMPVSQASIPATDEGFLRGDGVFEVARLYGGRPFAWDQHLRRMTNSAERLRLPFDAEQIDRDVQTLLAQSTIPEAALRVVVTRGGRRLAMTETIKNHADAVALVTVTFSPTRILDEVKSLSYAGNMLAGRIAQGQGADEALLVTPHGRVLEAPTSSIFYVPQGEQRLCTPPLEDHILDSITRGRLIALTGAVERVTTREDLALFEEAFLASTLREVQPIRAIDGRALAAAPGPLTARAAQLFAAQVAAELTVA